jgi:hypothetical protein
VCSSSFFNFFFYIASGQVLKVWGKVVRREGRKVFIEGGLVAEDGTVHAILDGITVECTREQLLR